MVILMVTGTLTALQHPAEVLVDNLFHLGDGTAEHDLYARVFKHLYGSGGPFPMKG